MWSNLKSANQKIHLSFSRFVHRLNIMVILPALFYLSFGYSYAASYKITGEIKLLSNLADTQNPPRERRKIFSVLVAETNWWIRSELIESPKELAADSPELEGLSLANKSASIYVGPEGNRRAVEYELSEGTLFFKQLFSINNKDGKQYGQRTPQFLGVAAEHIDIFSSGVPRFDTDLCFPVWLAYCSYYVFPEGESTARPMIWSGTADREDLVYTIFTKKEKGSRFYGEIDFRNNGYFPRYATNMTYAITRFSGNKNPFIEAHYHVTDWGVKDGIEYPRGSEFDFFSISSTSLIKRFVLSVSDFIITTEQLPQVTPTGLSVIRDFRGSHNNSPPLTYLTTNKYLDPNSRLAATVLNAQDKRLVSPEVPKAIGTNPRRILILVLMVSMAAAAVLLLRKSSTTTTKKE